MLEQRHTATKATSCMMLHVFLMSATSQMHFKHGIAKESRYADKSHLLGSCSSPHATSPNSTLASTDISLDLSATETTLDSLVTLIELHILNSLIHILKQAQHLLTPMKLIPQLTRLKNQLIPFSSVQVCLLI